MAFLRLLESIRTPFFDAVFQFITFFGEETLFLVFGMIFLWCVNKRYGYFLLYVSLMGASVNQFLKLLFCVPRPWLLDQDFTIVESARDTATGYSFPSGHTQSAGGLFLGIGRMYHRTALRIVCIAVALSVAFSRMYLGVHTPADVLVSLGVATLLVLFAAPLFQRTWTKGWKWYIPLFAALFIVLAAALIFAECFPLPANAIAEFSLNGKATLYKMLGASVGFALALWLDTRYIQYDTKAVWWAQVLKVSLGFVLVVSVRLLTKDPLLALFDGHDAAGAVRYFLMIMLGCTVWPLTFPFFARLGKKDASAPTRAA